MGFVRISEEDVALLQGERVYLQHGYPTLLSTKRSLHATILGLPASSSVEGDHIDGNPLNARRPNLRVVTHAQNMQNRGARAGSTCGIRGVTARKDGTFYASVVVDGVRYSEGPFATAEEAGKVASGLRVTKMLFTNEIRRLELTPNRRQK